MNNSNEYFKKIIEHMVAQAKTFLEEMGEFYPYAIIIDRDGNLRSLVIHLENDNPPSNLLIEKFEEQILAGIQKGDYLLGSLGVDVVMNKENGEKTDAIEIRTLKKGHGEWGYIYLPYKIENGKVKYGDLISS